MQSGVFPDDDVPPPSPDTDGEEICDEDIDDDSSSLPQPESPSLQLPCVAPMNRETRARRLVARLRQPFGALLIKPASGVQRAVDYKRVAADSMISVHFQQNVSLADLLDNVRTIAVL